MNSNSNWYAIEDINRLDSPALVVYPERIMNNIMAAIDMCHDIECLRPHVKTHKCPEVARMMISAGINKFKCATIAEAEMLGMNGAKDVLLAYQPTGPKLQRFVELIKKYPTTAFSCLIDNKRNADEQSGLFRENGLNVTVYIDLNVGMNRTGIVPGEQAIELYRYCATKDGLKITGMHAYDGHVRNPDLRERTVECDKYFSPVMAMRQKIQEKGLPLPLIIAGGSHSFPIHCRRDIEYLECSPGTFIYWDQSNSDYCPEQPFQPAALLITRVISLPDQSKLSIDLGHKSVAAENTLDKRVSFLDEPGLTPISQSEEHLVVDAGNAHSYDTGHVLFGLPYHICPTVALYERVITIENGRATGEWKNIARDRIITI